jgi:prevent-host-death family protein
MKVENIREVKTRFSRYIKDLSKTGSVFITKNGRPCAALVPVNRIPTSKPSRYRRTNASLSRAAGKKDSWIWKTWNEHAFPALSYACDIAVLRPEACRTRMCRKLERELSRPPFHCRSRQGLKSHLFAQIKFEGRGPSTL